MLPPLSHNPLEPAWRSICPAPGATAQNDIEPAFQAAKRARVEAQEARWVAEMEAMAEQQDKMKREGKEQGAAAAARRP